MATAKIPQLEAVAAMLAVVAPFHCPHISNTTRARAGLSGGVMVVMVVVVEGVGTGHQGELHVGVRTANSGGGPFDFRHGRPLRYVVEGVQGVHAMSALVGGAG